MTKWLWHDAVYRFLSSSGFMPKCVCYTITLALSKALTWPERGN